MSNFSYILNILSIYIFKLIENERNFKSIKEVRHTLIVCFGRMCRVKITYHKRIQWWNNASDDKVSRKV